MTFTIIFLESSSGLSPRSIKTNKNENQSTSNIASAAANAGKGTSWCETKKANTVIKLYMMHYDIVDFIGIINRTLYIS